MRIALTGSSGKLGTVVARELTAAGHEVIGFDVIGRRGPAFVQIDLTDYGQVVDAFGSVGDRHDGVDAIVHLGAVPAPGVRPDIATFHNNMAATFNVFHAATRLGIDRIVYASSETVQGLPFDVPPPYIPVDEEYPARPESVYSLVKHLEEQLAIELVRWHPGLSITALRFSNVMVPEDYAEFPSFDADPMRRKWNVWSYIDARDGAQAVLRALENAPTGFDRFLIAAADTVMSRPNAELVAEVFPDVEIRGDLGTNESLFSTEKARRLLGYEPKHSWRDHV
ncbi:NAD(P)-dependent oxidoreductase [Microbacterium sp. AISO3]|uniref:NAD-dependent epimerase/dehydratase family protein n=1 Tax=unclassified Microbacterium TaxID=2609290 RepID=UPI00038FF0EC|nr:MULTISPECIES: NAD(P)-dependent oxidoreductase [unclassified Microbacterium]OWP21369.1 NAD(P)-dependent oxidoreductase [Microbacterium sp. AISO3]QCR42060.1 NAD(P)-dependent oxidoreductase [Microbacterium sp. SGAir0570]GAD34872.1 nucleoside-diphosphate-sugar epimerase [Microbacterium sp. TS-1]